MQSPFLPTNFTTYARVRLGIFLRLRNYVPTYLPKYTYLGMYT